jgi:pimeloyl-ACP methyl ester carboxylesterase
MWVHGVEVGDPTAPTVLCNNACFMSEDFDELADQFRLVFVDSRGRGGSSPVTTPDQLPADAAVDDLEVVRQHLGAPRVSVVGWSAGGAVACAYARVHPDDVERVLTIGWLPPRKAPPTDADRVEFESRASSRVPTAALATVEAMRRDGIDRSDPPGFARASFFASAAFQTPRPQLLEAMRSTPWVHENEHGDHWREVMTWASEKPRRRRNGPLSCPLLVVFGDSDRGPLRAARDWSWEHDDSRLLVMKGVGHYPWLEDPNAFFAATRRFLEGGWPEGAEVIRGSGSRPSTS